MARTLNRLRSSAIACTALVSLAIAGPVACKRGHSPDTMATVNGKTITKAEVERYYLQSLGDNQPKPEGEQADIVRMNILRQLIDDEILQQRAAHMNLVATDEEVNAKLTEIKSPYTQEEFDNRLKSKSITVDDLKRDLRRSLTTNKLINKEIESKINIADSDIAGYYDAHKSEFNLVEPQYHLAQIVVTGVPAQQPGNLQNSKATNPADAKKKIDMLRNRLESGEDFGAVAMNFSEQPNTASNGGDMGFISESQLHSDAEIYAAVTKLKPNQITETLPMYDGSGTKRVMGYAIYKLLSREAAGQRELNDPRVQQAIRQQLREGRAQLLKNAYYEMLRDQAKIENFFAEEVFKRNF